MVTTGMLERVFMIQYSGQLGTAFIIYFQSQHWVITAKHIFQGTTPGDFQVFNNNQWNILAIRNYLQHPTQDICIFQVNINGFPNGNGFRLGGRMNIAQKICFLGFPLGISYTADAIFGNRPISIYKEGVLSGVLGQNDDITWLLDAHNNPGFSGGPVFSVPLNGDPRDISLVGVVTSYRFNRAFLFTVPTPGAFQQEVQSQTQYVKENPGLMNSAPIRFALSLLTSDWDAEINRTPLIP